ncbi:MAG: hypothetical protein KC466_00760 [Myxococcales bacterium]|nr:hypothetical protein [Myxococcales bacterium]
MDFIDDDFRHVLKSLPFSIGRLAAWLPAIQEHLTIELDLYGDLDEDDTEPSGLLLDAINCQAIWDDDSGDAQELFDPEALQ